MRKAVSISTESPPAMSNWPSMAVLQRMHRLAFTFARWAMDLNLCAGEINTRNGPHWHVGPAACQCRPQRSLIRLDSSTGLLRNLDPTNPTHIDVSAKDAPDLTPEQRSLLTLTVPPGIAVDHNGAPIAGGQLGISTVPPEMVRDMLPPGLLQHTFDITIQAPGIDRFTSSISMMIPNLSGAAPGSQLQFSSFYYTPTGDS